MSRSSAASSRSTTYGAFPAHTMSINEGSASPYTTIDDDNKHQWDPNNLDHRANNGVPNRNQVVLDAPYDIETCGGLF